MDHSRKLPPGPALTQARALRAVPFLKGPIPWAWLVAAGRLPGQALQVAISIRRWQGVLRCDVIEISLSRIASDFGMGRATAGRALAALGDAGLVDVEYRPGRRAVVTILEMKALPSSVDLDHEQHPPAP